MKANPCLKKTNKTEANSTGYKFKNDEVGGGWWSEFSWNCEAVGLDMMLLPTDIS